jgi:hypothetical protein
MLKAANYKITLPTKKPDHNISSLYKNFKKNYDEATELIDVLEKYIYPTQTSCNIT